MHAIWFKIVLLYLDRKLNWHKLAVDVKMALARRIYMQMIKVNKLFFLFSVFISHVIKTKNRTRSINKFKNLGYDR